MSWLSTLESTYDYLFEYSLKNPQDKIKLMPPGVITQNAHLEVVLNQDSEFVRGEFVNKEDAQTPVPATVKSAGRTSGAAPHAIFDQLIYVAGDMKDFITKEKEKATILENRFNPYLEILGNWKNTTKNEYLDIVYKYLEKKMLVKDLIKSKILELDEDGFIDMKVKRQNTDQTKYFVRFAIEKDGKKEELWNNMELLSEYSDYFMGSFNSKAGEFCYATGKKGYMQKLHGKNIRFAGDGAKLISSNDSTNYTFRGRFDKPEEAFLISGDASEKAHSALRWLIQNQGFMKNGYTVIAWNTENQDVVSPMEDSCDVAFGAPGFDDEIQYLDTAQSFAENFNKVLRGYSKTLDKNRLINIMALDAATPGRMSILYYSEKLADDYLEAIQKWHTEAAWFHVYKRIKEEKDGKNVNVSVNYYGAPSPYDIVLCAFGVQQGDFMRLGDGDKFVNQQLRRLLPCIVDGAKLPIDFMKGAYRNAISPQKKNGYNWKMCMSIACSLIRKYYIDRKGVNLTMALDKELKNRSYLYGRLLAIADKLEGDALKSKNIERPTTAMRNMEALSKRPYRTWKNIELSLNPYWKMISSKSTVFYKKQINQIMDLFETEDFINNRPLEPIFLLGYHCQTAELFKSRKQEGEENVEE